MCQSRRTFLKTMGFGVFGLTLGHRLFLGEALGVTPTNPFYDAMIQIFYEGGPSQTDTWDPKPGSKNNIFNTIAINGNDIYGKQIVVAEHFPNVTALLQDKNFGLALFRGMSHGNGEHQTSQEYMNCFWGTQVAPRKPSTLAVMAEYYKDQTGSLGVPSVMIDGNNGNAANRAKGANVPTAIDVSAGASDVVNELSMNVDRDRYDRRQRITAKVNEQFLATRQDAMVAAWNKAWSDAYSITVQGQAKKAFDLTGKTILQGNQNTSKDVATSMTLAQELVKAGVPYVALGIGGNDTHSGNRKGVTQNWANDTDPLVSGLAKNLEASGKRVLIMMGGEFGRTPDAVANGRDGRDHWGSGFSWAALSVNQPKFQTTAIGDTGPDGMWTEKDKNLVDPIHPGALGTFVYQALGFQVGIDPRYQILMDAGYDLPVDPGEIANGQRLMQIVGLV
jgi:hypothetical protein